MPPKPSPLLGKRKSASSTENSQDSDDGSRGLFEPIIAKSLQECTIVEPENEQLAKSDYKDVPLAMLLQSVVKPPTVEEIANAETIMKVDDPQVMVASKFGIPVKVSSFLRLGKGQLLNDEIINFFQQLMNVRNIAIRNLLKKLSTADTVVNYSSSFFFNSYLVSKLIERGEYNFELVQKWTKNIDVFGYDKLFLPIHISEHRHWTLVVVDVKRKAILWLDSIKGYTQCNMYTLSIRRWLTDIAVRTHRDGFQDAANWKILSLDQHIPTQTNDTDCGMYVLAFEALMSRRFEFPILFDKEDLNKFRLKVASSIMNGAFVPASVPDMFEEGL
jgi:Ulp1 family protease